MLLQNLIPHVNEDQEFGNDRLVHSIMRQMAKQIDTLESIQRIYDDERKRLTDLLEIIGKHLEDCQNPDYIRMDCIYKRDEDYQALKDYFFPKQIENISIKKGDK